MFNSDTEFLFPLRAIPSLSDLRGSDWKRLITHLSKDKTAINEKIAMTALVVKLAGCSGCNTDSFRAMKGCTQCSRLTIKRFKGSDEELLKNYQDCLVEIDTYLLQRDQ